MCKSVKKCQTYPKRRRTMMIWRRWNQCPQNYWSMSKFPTWRISRCLVSYEGCHGLWEGRRPGLSGHCRGRMPRSLCWKGWMVGKVGEVWNQILRQSFKSKFRPEFFMLAFWSTSTWGRALLKENWVEASEPEKETLSCSFLFQSFECLCFTWSFLAVFAVWMFSFLPSRLGWV